MLQKYLFLRMTDVDDYLIHTSDRYTPKCRRGLLRFVRLDNVISLVIIHCVWSVTPMGFVYHWGGGPRVVVSTAAFHARARGSVSGPGGLKETKMFLPHPRQYCGEPP